MQQPIPGINTDHPDGYIKQIVVGGSILDYRYKLYGDVNIGINGDILRDGYHAWKHRETYNALWERYSSLINGRVLCPEEMLDLPDQFDLVINTAPIDKLCMTPSAHQFETAAVYVTPTARYPGQPDNTIIFNANSDDRWVRSSKVFGVECTEWPRWEQGGRYAGKNGILIRKPISTNCTCYRRILRTGRFGKFRNETWIPDAYYDTLSAIESINRSHEWDQIERA